MLVVVWCVGFGGWRYPTPNVVRSGGVESSPVTQGSVWLLVHGEDDGQFMGALVCTGFAAVDAEMAWCDEPRNR